MGAKHRMTLSPEQRRQPSHRSARRSVSALTAACEMVSASLLCAASFAALITNTDGPDKRTVEASLNPPHVSQPVRQPVRQQGTLIAVSAGSVTARSANGYTQTYRVTPNTTVIVDGGGQSVAATPHFTINDQVDIVGTIEDGTALATAVADRSPADGAGPPMDYVTPEQVQTAATPVG